MTVFYWNTLTPDFCSSFFAKGSAVTIGGFDGPHAGHTQLFSAVLDYKKKHSHCKAGVVTFLQLPRSIKEKEHFAGEISTPFLRLEKIKNYGFDFVILIDFSLDFSKLQGQVFLLLLYERCVMQFLAVGEDFRCGFQLDTGKSAISKFAGEHNFEVLFIKNILLEGERISSSLIRTAVLSANFEKAAKLLGYPYTLDVQSCEWDKKIDTDSILFSLKKKMVSQIIPPVGQYAVWIRMHSEKTGLHTVKSILRVDVKNLIFCVSHWDDLWQIQALLFGDL